MLVRSRLFCVSSLILLTVACFGQEDKVSVGGPSEVFAREYFKEKLGRKSILKEDPRPSWELVSLEITRKTMDEKRHKYYYVAQVRALKDIYVEGEVFVNTPELSAAEKKDAKVLVKAGQLRDKKGRMVFRFNKEKQLWKGTQLIFRNP